MIPIGLQHMSRVDVEDYLNELCGDLNAGCLSAANFEAETEVVAEAYPFAYWNWVR